MMEWAAVEKMRTRWAMGLLGSLGMLGLGCVLAQARLAGLPIWGLATMIVFVKRGGRGAWLGIAGVMLGILLAGDLLWGQKSSFLLILAGVQLIRVLLGEKAFSGYRFFMGFWVLAGGTAWGWRGFPVGAEEIGIVVALGVVAAGFGVALHWLSLEGTWQGILLKGMQGKQGEDRPSFGTWMVNRGRRRPMGGLAGDSASTARGRAGERSGRGRKGQIVSGCQEGESEERVRAQGRYKAAAGKADGRRVIVRKDDRARRDGVKRARAGNRAEGRRFATGNKVNYWNGIRFEVSILVVSAVVVMGLGSGSGLGALGLAGINVQTVFLGLVVMLLAEFRGAGAAAGAGILLGVLMGGTTLSFVGDLPMQASQLMMSFGYAGVFGLLGWGCGVFSALGRVGVVSAYFVLSLIGGYALNVGSLTEYVISAGVAVLGYLIFAPRGSAGMSLKEYVMPQIETTVNKVKTLASMFEEVAWGMQAAGEDAEAKEPELSEMMNILAEKVCAGCTVVTRCWDKEYYRTYQFFLDVLEGAEGRLLESENNGGVDENQRKLQGDFQCVRRDRMELAADFIVNQEMERQVWKKNIKANRQALAGQYKSVSQVIHHVAHELFNHRANGPVQSWKRRHMSRIDFGVASFMPADKEISGDAYVTLGIGEDKVVFAVCDGMGTGEEAAKLSSSALGILQQLLSTGFDPEGALQALNAIFVLRSPEESFVTLDMAVVDLENHMLKLFKVGTPPSYIRRGKKVEVLRTSSLPAGVFNEIEVPLVERSFRSDVLILASDGVVDACQNDRKGDNWLEGFLEGADYPVAQDLANAIMDEAVKLAGGQINDDGIVLVVKQKMEEKRG